MHNLQYCLADHPLSMRITRGPLSPLTGGVSCLECYDCSYSARLPDNWLTNVLGLAPWNPRLNKKNHLRFG